MVKKSYAYHFEKNDRFMAALPNLKAETKEKMLQIERRRYWETQDLYIVAGQIYSLDLHPIDSWTLFRWMQDHNVPSRYIIRKDSRFFKKIEADGLTTDVVTVETDCLHDELLNEIELFVRARAFIVEWRTDSVVDIWLQHLSNCHYVFLRHGIAGLCINEAVKNVFRDEFNDINVTSEDEISLYSLDETTRKKCFIGGLPRYDLLRNLAATDSNKERAIFVMFTWRESLNKGETSLYESDYYKGIKNLLESKNIQKLRKNNVRLVFAPHHVIAHVLKKGTIKGVDFVFSQEEISYWVKHAHALITDFSSIAYDFLFLEKPVIFWIPDQSGLNTDPEDRKKIDTAIARRPIFFNSADTKDEVWALIDYYIRNNFQLEEEKKSKSNAFFPYRSGFSSRVFANVSKRVDEEPINHHHKSKKMKRNPKLSVIIPAYNAEKYLSTCLESIIEQNYEDFEVIIVNDGSTDYTRQLCDKYSFEDMRIRVVHQENVGVSSARNKGIELAQGEYITFVDADDWVSPDYFTTVINTRPESDLLFFGNTHHYNDGTSQSYSPGNRFATEQTDREDLLLRMAQNDCHYEFFGYTWNKRFKTKIIREHNIRFLPGLSLREDEVFTDQYARHANSVATTDCYVYNYRFSYGGLTYRFHPGKEVLLLAQGLEDATKGIRHKRLNALKKSKVFHYMFTSTLNLHTKESLQVFKRLYFLYQEQRDILNSSENPFLDDRTCKRYRRIFAHSYWLSKLYFLVKRRLMKKNYNAV